MQTVLVSPSRLGRDMPQILVRSNRLLTARALSLVVAGEGVEPSNLWIMSPAHFYCAIPA